MSRRYIFRNGFVLAFLLPIVAFGSCQKRSLAPLRIESNPHEVPPYLLSEIRAMSNEQRRVTPEFVIRNTGDHPASLVFRGTDCSCTGAFHKGTEIIKGDVFELAPGGHLPVTLEVQLPEVAGKYEYHAYFGKTPASTDSPPVALTIAGKNETDILVEPYSLLHEFEDTTTWEVQKTLTITRTVRDRTVTEMGDPIFESLPEILQILEIKKAGSLRRLKDDLVSQSWIVRVNIALTANSRANFQCVAQFTFPETEQEKFPPAKSVTLHVKRKSGIDAPAGIPFGVAKPGETATKKILIQSVDAKPFKVLGIESTDPAFGFTSFSGLAASSSHWLELSFMPEKAGETKGILSITTDHPSVSHLEIQASGWGKENGDSIGN